MVKKTGKDNLRRTGVAILTVLFLGAVSMSFVQARQDVCEQIRQEQVQYLEAQVELEESLYALVSEGAQDLDVVHSHLMKFLGKYLGDISSEILRVQLVAETLNSKADLVFEHADQDDDRAYNWVDGYPQCGWGERTAALEEWQTANYENLSTVASFLAGYANMMLKWAPEWEELRENKSLIDEESFSQVEEIRKGLEESIELMSDTFEYTKEAFEAARP